MRSAATKQDSGNRLNPVALDKQLAAEGPLTAEIVIALCGPMGTPLHEVGHSFEMLLKGTDYNYENVTVIRLSDEVRRIGGLHADCSRNELIEKENQLRAVHGNAYLARVAIRTIALAREKLNAGHCRQTAMFHGCDADPSAPIFSRRTCHIIDSIKNVDELRLLRSVYGDMLHVIGVYAPIEVRIDRLSKRAHRGEHTHLLIDRDSGEEVDHGQQVSEIFPQSDFFLRADSGTDTQLQSSARRFLDLMMGTKIATPTANERAMYAAYSAARNSACLSRQVGAALLDSDGEVLSVGWNDVPKPFGGLYESGANVSADYDRRCWNRDGGHCCNDEEKDLIASDLVWRMIREGIVSAENRERAVELIRHGSQLKSLIEFSRAVHAEMHALLNAGATNGAKIRGGRLFVTTYPCHSCARHIVAAGIREVCFLEPYRKSLATKLHSDAITEREGDGNKVRIFPYDGVAPSRFLKFFSARSEGRKDPRSGKMRMHAAYPVTAITLEAIPTLESVAIRGLRPEAAAVCPDIVGGRDASGDEMQFRS
ncbi:MULTISPECIES: anti-phage dCTP deaminase [unclassified Cupriavidus]|uniref:anti-phage dCTP deaminase n=1 Tax=unclassified Cupriavidus TaxID=2640874 RepID=UPI00313DE606